MARKRRRNLTTRMQLHCRKGRIYWSKLQVGEAVQWCSRTRPDHIPDVKKTFGIVVRVDIWSLLVIFRDFPEEPIYCGVREVKRLTGTRARRDQAEIQKMHADYLEARATNW